VSKRLMLQTLIAMAVVVGMGQPAVAQDPNQVVSTSDAPAQFRANPDDVLAFWTPERLRDAVSLDVTRDALAARTSLRGTSLSLATRGESLLATSGVPGQAAETVRGTANVERLLTRGAGGIEPQLGDAPWNFSRYRLFPETPRDPDIMYRTFPYRLTGKLFFVIPGEGTFVCSASSVNSENHSLVWTAGHCVATPLEGGRFVFHTNFLFVPGYRGQASCALTPFGCWTAKDVNTLIGWAVLGLFEYDHGAIVANLGGNGLPRKVGDRIGWLGFTANIPQDQHWHVHGYPQAAPFDGNHHEICTAQLAGTDLPTGGFFDPETSGIGCDQTGGTSGGAWVINFSGLGGPTNLLNGNNSYRYGGGPPNSLRLYGPYFSDGAINLRDWGQFIPVP